MPKVILSGRIVVPGQDLDLVLRELPAHTELTRKEPGCLVFEVNQDTDNPTIFHVYEEFIDQSAFNAHQRRVAHSRWGQATAGVQRHYDIREGS